MYTCTMLAMRMAIARLEMDHRLSTASSTNLTKKTKLPASPWELQQLSTMTDRMNWVMTYMAPLNQWRKNIRIRPRLSELSHGKSTEMLITRATSRSMVASCWFAIAEGGKGGSIVVVLETRK